MTKTEMYQRAWLDGLERGLPPDFSFNVLRSAQDASAFMFRLPNEERGKAARIVVSQADKLGRGVAYQALIDAWDHDHGEVLKAFGTAEALVSAFRTVVDRSRRKRTVRAWRGCGHHDGWYGLSWTLDRDCACWFAFRLESAPFVYACDIDPRDILTEHDGRRERELIVDIDALEEGIFLDDRGTSKSYVNHSKSGVVSAAALRNWKLGRDRWVRKIAKRRL